MRHALQTPSLSVDSEHKDRESRERNARIRLFKRHSAEELSHTLIDKHFAELQDMIETDVPIDPDDVSRTLSLYQFFEEMRSLGY